MQNPIMPGFISTGRFSQIDFLMAEILRITMTVAVFIIEFAKKYLKKLIGYSAPFVLGTVSLNPSFANERLDKMLTKTNQKILTLCREAINS